MAERPVLRHPHPSLKRVARELEPADEAEIRRVGRDLLDTMHATSHCLGLAAPQIDELVRIIVVDVRGHRKAAVNNGELLLVNPRVLETSGSQVAREGCLSIPDFT